MRNIAEIRTAYHCCFDCECGGDVTALGTVPGAHDKVTISGVECDSCEKTYTVEITTSKEEDK